MAGALPSHSAGPWGLRVSACVSLPAITVSVFSESPPWTRPFGLWGGTGGGLMSTQTVSMGAAVRHNGNRGLAGGWRNWGHNRIPGTEIAVN